MDLPGVTVVPASLNSTRVIFKDVVIDPVTGVSARLYSPTLSHKAPSKKLTILVYYHGGGFTTESTSSPTYHPYLTSLTANAGVIIVSIDYRRAPKHPVPTAHLDARESLRWIVGHSAGGADTWVVKHGVAWLAEHGDFDRLFIAGDSAGGNIAHHIALCHNVKLEGVALVHPFFWGKEPIENEISSPALRWVWEILWAVAYPAMKGLDDPLINPLAAAAPSLKCLACKKVIVFTADMDDFKERGKAYHRSLVESGWEGKPEYFEGKGGHVYHLLQPDSKSAAEMMEKMVDFLTK